MELARLGTLLEQGFLSVHKELQEIKVEVKRTNGRVTALEMTNGIRADREQRTLEGLALTPKMLGWLLTLVGTVILGTLAVLTFFGRL